jgi:hypothetical protein
VSMLNPLEVFTSTAKVKMAPTTNKNRLKPIPMSYLLDNARVPSASPSADCYDAEGTAAGSPPLLGIDASRTSGAGWLRPSGVRDLLLPAALAVSRRQLGLTTILGLLLALAVGSVAVTGRQLVRTATGDSLVVAWNQQVLDVMKGTRTGPTIAARALAVVHTVPRGIAKRSDDRCGCDGWRHRRDRRRGG